jgi:hypothetical protein
MEQMNRSLQLNKAKKTRIVQKLKYLGRPVLSMAVMTSQYFLVALGLSFILNQILKWLNNDN